MVFLQSWPWKLRGVAYIIGLSSSSILCQEFEKTSHFQFFFALQLWLLVHKILLFVQIGNWLKISSSCWIICMVYIILSVSFYLYKISIWSLGINDKQIIGFLHFMCCLLAVCNLFFLWHSYALYIDTLLYCPQL